MKAPEKHRGELIRRWLKGSAANDMPGWVYVVQIIWIVALLGLFLAVEGSSDRLGLRPSFGRVPLEAPWLGAVGGLLASLGGIVYYARGSWKSRFNYWHPIKPLMGAATGGVSCLLIIVLLRAASGTKTPSVDSSTLDAAAFIFGFAESAFRQLIKTVTDIFLKPGNINRPGPPPPSPRRRDQVAGARDNPLVSADPETPS